MTGVRPGIYWQLTWRFVAPVLLTLLVLLSVYKQLFSKTPEYDAWIAEAGKSNCHLPVFPHKKPFGVLGIHAHHDNHDIWNRCAQK